MKITDILGLAIDQLGSLLEYQISMKITDMLGLEIDQSGSLREY